ncbi:MAG: hypothetical protein IME98_01170, partial [Proteobacteria bacterium]|nr:hypothetical protein [Pseudomonadota bacterium]
LDTALALTSITSQKVSIKNALGVCYARLGRMKRARAEFYGALELDPLNKETQRNIEFLDPAP